MDRNMRLHFLATLILLCCVQSSVARGVQKVGRGAQWIVSVQLENERVCLGVHVLNEWILTLGKCTEKGNIRKYKVVMGDGQVMNVLQKKRSSTGRMLALLQIEISSDNDIEYPKLDNRDLTAQYEGDFLIYSVDESDNMVATGMDIIRDGKCLEEDVGRIYKRNKHDCFRTFPDSISVCQVEAGLPIFGKVKGKWVLHGFSTTKCDICDDSYKQATRVQPHRKWVKKVLKGCGQPPDIANGVVDLDNPFSSAFGSTASVTCDPGFRADEETIECKNNGKWQRATCIIEDCGSLGNVTFGALSLDSDSTIAGATATVTCDEGHDADEVSITCLSSGWEVATCTPKDCGPLASSLTDGTLNLDSANTTFGSTATVSCNAGYAADKASISCLAGGSWDTATCTIKDCGAISSSITNGSVALTSTTTTYGSTASVTCDAEYTALHATIDCQASGVWLTAECYKECSDPVTNNGIQYRLCEGDGTRRYSESKGRVELYINSQWGTVCDDDWDSSDAGVVCRILGYTSGTAVGRATYGQGSGPIWYDNFQCVGSETSLPACPRYFYTRYYSYGTWYTTSYTSDYYELGEHNCNHSEDAGVICT